MKKGKIKSYDKAREDAAAAGIVQHEIDAKQRYIDMLKRAQVVKIGEVVTSPPSITIPRANTGRMTMIGNDPNRIEESGPYVDIPLADRLAYLEMEEEGGQDKSMEKLATIFVALLIHRAEAELKLLQTTYASLIS